MSNDTSVFPVALLENWIARGETPRNVNDARKHQESVNRKRLSTYFDASLLQIVTRPQADFRVLIRTVPILDYFRIADHPGVVSWRPQSQCRVWPPVRWEMPLSSFPRCIKSSLRLACCGCLAASLH